MYTSTEANSVDLDQTAPSRAVGSGSTLFVEETSNSSADDKDTQHILLYAL